MANDRTFALSGLVYQSHMRAACSVPERHVRSSITSAIIQRQSVQVLSTQPRPTLLAYGNRPTSTNQPTQNPPASAQHIIISPQGQMILPRQTRTTRASKWQLPIPALRPEGYARACCYCTLLYVSFRCLCLVSVFLFLQQPASPIAFPINCAIFCQFCRFSPCVHSHQAPWLAICLS